MCHIYADEYNSSDERSPIDRHQCHMAAKLMCLLMRIMTSSHRYTGYINFVNTTKSRFIDNSSLCSTTELFTCIHLTSCSTAIIIQLLTPMR